MCIVYSDMLVTSLNLAIAAFGFPASVSFMAALNRACVQVMSSEKKKKDFAVNGTGVFSFTCASISLFALLSGVANVWWGDVIQSLPLLRRFGFEDIKKMVVRGLTFRYDFVLALDGDHSAV